MYRNRSWSERIELVLFTLLVFISYTMGLFEELTEQQFIIFVLGLFVGVWLLVELASRAVKRYLGEDI